jgi:hypothetical protein
VPECKGRHAIWLHELQKDISGKEGQVHVVQGETSWRTPEEAWKEDEMEEEEEEVMFVNMTREVEGDSEEEEEMQGEATTSDKEMEDEIKRAQVVVDECYCRRAGISIEVTKDRLLTEEELDSLSEQLGDGTGAQAKRRRKIEKM